MFDLNDLANVVAVTAILPLAAFIYYYGTVPVEGRKHLRKYSNRWKSTSIGKTLMYQKISWLAFLIFVLIGVFAPAYLIEPYVRLIMYSSLVVLFWRVFFNLRLLQKTPPTDEPEDEGQEGIHSAAGSQTAETPVIVTIVRAEESDKK